MLNTQAIFTTFLALVAIAAGLLAQIELWQRKEYRLDRYLASLTEPALLRRLIIYAVALLIFALKLPLLAIIILFAGHAWRISTRGLHRPRWTNKIYVLTIAAVILIMLSGYLLLSSLPNNSALAALALASPWLIALAVGLTNLVAHTRKQQIINNAQRLRKALPNLKSVGLTGSFGKTSTKHFLSQLIPDAIVTTERRNSEFPVAQDMLKQLKPDTKIYIAEMGAYKPGEIAALANLVKPQIGLITAVGNQHLATFGSQANILKTKWELIESLPKDGVAILNADDSKLKAAGNKIPTVIWYSLKKPADIYADNIIINPRSISFRLHIKDSARDVTIPLAGASSLSNVLAAVAVATVLGEASEQLFQRVQQLKPYPQTMEIVPGTAGATIIDDSYSTNEHGVLTAIEHLQKFPQSDQRIILTPLIELGPEAAAVHQRIGQALAASGATVYVYGTAYHKQLSTSGGTNIQTITNPRQLTEQATQDLTSDSVVLLAGRLPDVVRKAFISHSS